MTTATITAISRTAESSKVANGMKAASVVSDEAITGPNIRSAPVAAAIAGSSPA